MPTLSLSARGLLLFAALLSLTYAGRAAQPPAATNAAPAQVQIAKSVFLDPSADSKDPFFPLSTRHNKVPMVPTSAASVPAPLVDLQLKGISGAANRRLAIINNRTFATGEEGEVTSTSGVAHVTCKAIQDDSVRVLVNGQERILRLRPNS